MGGFARALHRGTVGRFAGRRTSGACGLRLITSNRPAGTIYGPRHPRPIFFLNMLPDSRGGFLRMIRENEGSLARSLKTSSLMAHYCVAVLDLDVADVRRQPHLLAILRRRH